MSKDTIDIWNRFQTEFELPYNAVPNFRKALKTKLDNYLEFYKENFTEYHTLSDCNIDGLNAVETTTKVIIDSLDNYYDGKSWKAYSIINNQLNCLFDKHGHVKIPELTYLGTKIYFRISSLTGKEMSKSSFNKLRIFHIPFNKRTKVNSYRYSIAGFPSLYLGENLYVCTKEVGLANPVDPKFIGSAFKLKKPLKVIKFLRIEQFTSYSDFYLPNNLPAIFSYLMLFPFLIASSFKVYHEKDPFKPEYIIPQMLLSFVRNNDKIHGIMYPSTKINYSVLKGEHPYNLVLPVKTTGETNHCEELRTYFDWTKPQLLRGISNKPIFEELPKEIRERMGIENNYCEDRLMTYGDTIYGKMEAQLVRHKLYRKPNEYDLILGKKLRNFDKNIEQ